MKAKLNSGDMHLMRLLLRDRKPDGWTTVSSTVWPVIEKLPAELVELHPDKNAAKLTSEGETVIAWL